MRGVANRLRMICVSIPQFIGRLIFECMKGFDYGVGVRVDIVHRVGSELVTYSEVGIEHRCQRCRAIR